MATQCYGFARYCEWRVYGHHDGESGYFKEYAENKGTVDVTTLKKLLLGCMPATHVRLKGGHSICIISTSDSGVYYADANTDGYCMVKDYQVSWDTLTDTVNNKSGIEAIWTWRDGTIPIIIDIPDIPDIPDDPIYPTVVTNDYIVHIDSPSGSLSGQDDIEISGWVASKIQLTSVMGQSDALPNGQINMTEGATDASAELNNAGYGEYAHKYRFHGVIPRSGLTAGRTYSFSVWMDLATGGQTKLTTSSFILRGGSPEGPVPANPVSVNSVVHIDSPTGTFTNDNVEISGWVASMKAIGSCMAESAAIPGGQYNLTASLTDASGELDGAGYGAFPYKYRFSGVIPKYSMQSFTDYDFKVWFNYTDGSSSGVTTSTFHTNEMTNTEIVITSPKGGSNFANNANVPITGYILSDSGLWYILCQAGDQQFALDGADDAALAAANGYEHAFRFSKTIRCDSLPANSMPTIEVWTKNAGDGVELHKQVTFTTGARVYGSMDDFKSKLDNPTNGMRATKDFEITGWVTAHAPIGYVMMSAVPTDGSEGGFQLNLDIEPTSELDAGYSNYEYRIRYRGIVEFGKLKSNTTYRVGIWCGLVDSSGNGNQRFLDGCDTTFFSTGTVTTPVYTNTFDANGGTGAPVAVQKTWHQDITLPAAVPEKLGSTFLGWNFAQDAYEAKYVPGAKFSEETDHTLYAVWEPARLIPVDTTSVAETAQVCFGGQKIVYRLTPAQSTNYRLTAENGVLAVRDASGASLGSGSSFSVDLQASQTYFLYAGFSSSTRTGEVAFSILRGYPITFDANGGTGAPGGVYYQYHGEALDIPAQQPVRQISVTLDANGGSAAVASRSAEQAFNIRSRGVDNGLLLTYSAAFQGWSSNDADYQVDEEFIYNKPTTLYASWQYPAIGAIAAVQREGYELMYWADDSLVRVDESYIALGDVTLHAIWKLKQYTIQYDLNGAEGSIAPSRKIHGIAAKLTNVIPEREGFTFLGWALSKTAEAADYLSGASFTLNADKTLYAVWEADRIPVTGFGFAEDEYSVSVNGTIQLVPVIEPADATDQSVTWSSLKPAVATVDEAGWVTGVSEGTAMLKAVCNDNNTTVYVRIRVTKAQALTLPVALTRIEDEAFMGDNSVKIVYVGGNVTFIGSHAFANCASLTEIHIPSTVTDIAVNAFEGCPNLVIYCEPDSTAWEIALLKNISWVEE